MGASSPKHFVSDYLPLSDFAADVSNDEIKNEPMFFNCDALFALSHGGPITRAFLKDIPRKWLDQPHVFDSRVHMLMPGWYPAIPGYHHDDVPRPDIPVGQHFATAGQPDYDNPRYRAEHILGLVNAEVAPTDFAVGECTMPAIPEGGLIYRAWHKEVERLIADGSLSRESAPDRRLIYFNSDAFHTGVKAVGSGWRWFGRISINTDRASKVTNEIRHQAQVYLEFPMEGW